MVYDQVVLRRLLPPCVSRVCGNGKSKSEVIVVISDKNITIH